MMNSKIRASSIVEVVIAVSIIAICFGIASLIYVRMTKVTTTFKEVKSQTEIQVQLWESLLADKELEYSNEFIENEKEFDEKGLKLIEVLNADQKVIWEQVWLKDEK